MAHGVSRVLIAKAQRNSTRGAFLSGFMASGFAAPKSWGMFGGTMATAVVAGTVSQTTGGKFANGAVSGSFIHMFNNILIELLTPTPLGKGSELKHDKKFIINKDGKQTYPQDQSKFKTGTEKPDRTLSQQAESLKGPVKPKIERKGKF